MVSVPKQLPRDSEKKTLEECGNILGFSNTSALTSSICSLEIWKPDLIIGIWLIYGHNMRRFEIILIAEFLTIRLRNTAHTKLRTVTKLGKFKVFCVFFFLALFTPF